jgi:hypothetical protein
VGDRAPTKLQENHGLERRMQADDNFQGGRH